MKIVVFSGAGISAESGLNTFRDNNGLWHDYRIEDVATPEAFAANPKLVLDFYNQRQKDALAAKPNLAHKAIAALQSKHDVCVITQNVDGLHEAAGSSHVIHLHGRLDWAQASTNPEKVYPLNGMPLQLGQRSEDGELLRPHIVWFGEAVQQVEPAIEQLSQAEVLLVVGTSLSVFPAAGFIDFVPNRCKRYINALDLDDIPDGFQFIRGKATAIVPSLAAQWL